MDARTLEALKGSIAKWDAIVNHGASDRGSTDCPLCYLFRQHRGGACTHCPVMKTTGKSGCRGTPYTEAWLPSVRSFHVYGRSASTTESMAAAQAELAFLQSLLPKETA